MAEITYWGGTLTLNALEQDASFGGVINGEAAYAQEFAGVIDGDDAKINALLAAHRAIAWEVQLDLGAGFEVIPPDDYRLGVIHESIREWSATASIELIGERYNPLVYGIFRGFVPIIISMIFGEPGVPFTMERFRGSLSAGPWDPDTRTLSATCLDDGAKHAETSVAVNIEASDGEVRDAYLATLLESHGITIGAQFDMGPNGSKPITKPYSLTDQRLLDFALDWIAPCGSWMYWRNGAAQVSRYSKDRPSARALSPRDVISIGPLQGPPAPAQNKVTVVCVNYDVVSAGSRTISFSEETYETYARKGAVKEQNKTTGAITTVAYGDTVATYRRTRRVYTVQTFVGDVLTHSHVEEWGYAARRTARLQVETDGTTVNHLAAYDCYQFDDGNWYSETVEHWQQIQRTVLGKTVASGVVTASRETIYRDELIQSAIFVLTGSPPSESFHPGSALPLTEDGLGVSPASATTVIGSVIGYDGSTIGSWLVPYSETIKTFSTDSAGYLTRETSEEWIYSFGSRATSQRAGSYVQGFDGSGKTYWKNSSQLLRKKAERKVTYRDVNGTSYLAQEDFRDFETGKRFTPPVQSISGARPRPEEIIPQSRSRELRQSAEDVVRSTLNGVREDVIVNEFCQDAEDLGILANAELRDLSSWPVSLVMPIDHALRADFYVELGEGFGEGMTGMRFLVESVDLDPQGNTMSAGLRWYPPEVADAE